MTDLLTSEELRTLTDSRRSRQRWTRARYYKAKHLDRLLCQLGSVASPPDIVEKYHELVQHTPGLHGVDPLTRPLRDRHWDRFGDPDIPF